MCRQDELYEVLVRRLTKDDPVPVREPDPGQEGGWRLLYLNLYHRERNWAWGNPQSIRCVFALFYANNHALRSCK